MSEDFEEDPELADAEASSLLPEVQQYWAQRITLMYGLVMGGPDRVSLPPVAVNNRSVSMCVRDGELSEILFAPVVDAIIEEIFGGSTSVEVAVPDMVGFACAAAIYNGDGSIDLPEVVEVLFEYVFLRQLKTCFPSLTLSMELSVELPEDISDTQQGMVFSGTIKVLQRSSVC